MLHNLTFLGLLTSLTLFVGKALGRPSMVAWPWIACFAPIVALIPLLVVAHIYARRAR